MLLTIDRVSKAFGDNQVLNAVSLAMARGCKWGLVGANGVGKSTLVKLIVGELEADSGAIQVEPGAVVGYLPQVLATHTAVSIDDLLATDHQRVRSLAQRMEAIAHQMAGPAAGADLDTLLAEYGALNEEFDRLSGYDLDHRAAVVLTGLGVDHLPRDRQVGTLSGGEKARLGLAALLLQEPDLLLLDEPTNHLDFAALAWLEEYLQDYRGAVLAVSHDRTFLNAVAEAIVEIDEHSRAAVFYAGSYDFFAAEQAGARARWEERYAAEQEEIHDLRRFLRSGARQVAHNRKPSDGDKFVYHFKGARVEATVARNVHAAEEKLRRIEENPTPRPPQPLRINPEFTAAELLGKTPLLLSGVSHGYGGRHLLDDITLTIGPRDRIVIVGPNGAGKSTLLKVMAGRLAPAAGDVVRAPSVTIGYLDQEQETLAQTGTLFAAYAEGRTGDWETLKAELLSYGLFTWPDLLKPVASLSTGQKRKLQLAQLMASRANLLLLDEPTNHISLAVLEELETALAAFPGPVVAISHDRRFIERLAQQVWELRDGRLIRYLGGWTEYCAPWRR